MDIKLNYRQERFCQLVKQGYPPYRAYPMAGYAFNDGSPYRLHGNARVQARLAQLTRGLAVETKVTVQSLTDELEEARQLAAKVDQPGAMVQAIATKAKLHGHLIDRKETGKPGEFDQITSKAELIEAARAEFGDKAAAWLADQMDDEQPEPPLPDNVVRFP